MTNFIYIFAVIILVKLILNLYKYFLCKYYLRQYESHTQKPSYHFAEHTLQVIKLFKDAGVQDSTATVIETTPIAIRTNSNVSIFDNLTNTRPDVVGLATQMFHKAIGVYRSRALEAINPLFWLEFIITLPKQVLTYFGVPPENVLIKIFQILYWALSATVALIVEIFPTEIHKIITDWFSNMFP